MKEQQYKSATVTLNYVEGPDNGEPLLLVHGNMSRWQALEPLIDSLADNYHVYALDLRGHGKSSHAAGTYVIKTYMQDVADFIKNVIGTPTCMIGISLGGMIGVMLAAHHPELIRALIIGDSPLTMETIEPIILAEPEMGRKIMARLHNKEYDKLYEEMQDDAWVDGVRICDIDIVDTTFYHHREMMDGYEIEKLLPKMQCPLLIMRGEIALGSMISDSDVIKAQALLPALQDLKIAGAGHAFPIDKQIVQEFFDRR